MSLWLRCAKTTNIHKYVQGLFLPPPLPRCCRFQGGDSVVYSLFCVDVCVCVCVCVCFGAVSGPSFVALCSLATIMLMKRELAVLL